jgi:hypothetical protein
VLDECLGPGNGSVDVPDEHLGPGNGSVDVLHECLGPGSRSVDVPDVRLAPGNRSVDVLDECLGPGSRSVDVPDVRLAPGNLRWTCPTHSLFPSTVPSTVSMHTSGRSTRSQPLSPPPLRYRARSDTAPWKSGRRRAKTTSSLRNEGKVCSKEG